jgi:hypothetical protein
MVAAAAICHLPPRVLPSIQAVEGGQAGLVKSNTDRSADLGLMQINSIGIKPLARYTQMTEDPVRNRLICDPCFNITASAAIMQLYINEARHERSERRPYVGTRLPSFPHVGAWIRLQAGSAGCGKNFIPGTTGPESITPRSLL